MGPRDISESGISLEEGVVWTDRLEYDDARSGRDDVTLAASLTVMELALKLISVESTHALAWLTSRDLVTSPVDLFVSDRTSLLPLSGSEFPSGVISSASLRELQSACRLTTLSLVKKILV